MKRELRHIPQLCNYITFSKVNTSNLKTYHACYMRYTNAHNAATQDAEQKGMDA